MHRLHDGAGFVRLGEVLAARAAQPLDRGPRAPAGRSGIHTLSTEKRGKGGEEGLPVGPVNGSHNIRSDPFWIPEMGVQGEEPRAGVDKIESVAHHLASALQDDRSLAFYQLVAAAVPREVIRDALVRALDVPERDVRRSRGAIFTAIVRPYLGRRRHAGHPKP